MAGPLHGLKVIELAGLGPAPLACMLLADLGADVVRVDRPGGNAVGFRAEPRFAIMNRGKQVVELDLKDAQAVQTVMDMVASADVMVEGYRPGVAERLGLGPEVCRRHNPRLVYGRVTGWGQDGPLAQVAGHDINYLALSGALAAMGPRDKPAIPLNLLGDFGGGSLYLVFGILSALFERQRSGQGQVVDAAMVDGVASLMSTFFGQYAAGTFSLQRQSNLLDGAAPFYDVYETADGKWVSVGALESKFFEELVTTMGLDADWPARQYDRAGWPELRLAFKTCFASRTRDEWCALLEHRDVCFAPVLSLDETAAHPHHVQRRTYTQVDGIVQPSPAPRFDRTPAACAGSVSLHRTPAPEVLARWTNKTPGDRHE